MVLTLKLTLIFWTSKTTDYFKGITDSDLTALNDIIHEIFVAFLQEWWQKHRSKNCQICVVWNILQVTLIAKTLSGYRLMLTLILAKSLTVDPFNCWPLNVRMSVIRSTCLKLRRYKTLMFSAWRWHWSTLLNLFGRIVDWTSKIYPGVVE